MHENEIFHSDFAPGMILSPRNVHGQLGFTQVNAWNFDPWNILGKTFIFMHENIIFTLENFIFMHKNEMFMHETFCTGESAKKDQLGLPMLTCAAIVDVVQIYWLHEAYM